MSFVATIDSVFGQRWPRSSYAAHPVFELPAIITPGSGSLITVDAEGRVTSIAPAAVADITGLEARLSPLEAYTDIDHSLEPVTNGDVDSPELLFADGDIITVQVLIT